MQSVLDEIEKKIQSGSHHENGTRQVDIQNSDGFTALHMAAIDRKPARVNLLISR